VLPFGFIATLAKDRKNEKEQAKERAKVARDLEEANKKVVQAIADIETELIKEDTNIVDQVKAYEKALKDTGITNELGEIVNQVAKDALDSQYATISFISTVTKGNTQVLDNIKKLTDFGNVTTENIIKLAKVFSSIEETQKKGQKAADFLNAINDLDLGKHSTLDDVIEEYLGTTSGVTVKELITAMMETVKKDSDDNYRKDGKGNYKNSSGYGMSNEEFTNFVKLLQSMIAEGLGDYSFELIEKLSKVTPQASSTKMFADFINAIGGAVTEGMTVDERQQA
jgi:hypothetical protein